MSGSHFDTIVALATPKGMGALAVIRVSGVDAINVVDEFFRGKSPLKDIAGGRVVVGEFRSAEEFLDEVVVSVYKAPHSYTGENLVEISMHGSSYIYGKILECLLSRVRMASPGEFTKRAFLNGKMDLTKAESVDDLIRAKTAKSHQLATGQYQGKLFEKIKSSLSQLSERRAELELEIDFMEQGLEQIEMSDFRQKILSIKDSMEELLSRADDGSVIKDGYKVVLVGGANAGKSSIFNGLLATNRAIVTPIAGTTRDYLEEMISIDGYLVRIFDTAGLRETDCQIEKEGINKSLELLQEADLILNVGSPEVPFQKLPEKADGLRSKKVFNKIDLLTKSELDKLGKDDCLLCSTLDAEGLKAIKNEITGQLQQIGDDLESGVISSARQKSCVSNCLQYLQKALETIDDGLGYEFIAFELGLASGALEEMVGKVSSDDILHNIFANFCIGK